MRVATFLVVLIAVSVGMAQGVDRAGPLYAPDGPASGRAAGDQPIVINPGPQLFLDDYLVESSRNVVRRPITLTRDPAIGNPIVTGAKPDGSGDKNFQPWVTVLRDPQSKRFRMWYNVGVDVKNSRIGTMDSEDGINWTRPHRELARPNNINFCDAVIDEGAQFSPSSQRYKMAFFSTAHEVEIWASPDGLDWSFFSRGPSPTNDIINLVHDTPRGRYLITHGARAVPADGYKGSTQNIKEGYRRIVGQSSSADLKTWTPPRRIIMPGERDEGITEFYGAGGLLVRGQMILATVKVLRDDLPRDAGGPVEGIGYTTIAWTRDGENWIREAAPLLDRDHAPQAWDHAHAWVDCQLAVGDDVYLYYGGYKSGHKVNRFEERQIGLVKMKRDRYVAREAGGDGGILRTPLLGLHGKRLTVNVEPAAGGEVRARLLSKDDQPIKGFDFADCQPITADDVATPLHWVGTLAELNDTPLRLEFSVKNARLYGFELQ